MVHDPLFMNPPRPAIHDRPSRILRGLSILALSSTLGAQILPDTSDDDEMGNEDGGLPAMEMLVEGSILKKIIIPQYDEDRRLSSVLRADQLVMVDKKTIEATKARIEFFHPDQSLRGSIDLEASTLHNQRFLRSDETVQIVSEDMNATGTGLVYDLKLSRGFLHGPTQTDIFIESTTAMNAPRSSTLGLAGITLMAAVATHAEEIPRFTKQQMLGLDRLAESRSQEFLITTEATEKKLQETAAEVSEANQTLESFLEEAAIDLPKGEPVDLTTEVPGPESETNYRKPATIQSKNGFYFDSKKGIILFLNEVTVDHPEFKLTGADKVEVFLEKEETKTEEPEADANGKGDEEADAWGTADFGDPSQIVATGAVVVERKTLKPGDKKAKASGRQMVMDLKTNDLIIRGGRPWILSDTANGYVVDPNGYIRINLKTGDASFVGDSRGFVETDKPQQ